MRFDSASAHLGKNLFSFNIIQYMSHTSSAAHVLIEYTGLIYRLNRAILTLNPILKRSMTMIIPTHSKRTPPPPNRERLVFD